MRKVNPIQLALFTIALALSATPPEVQAAQDGRCPWIFFDLGAGSLVETPEPFAQSIFFAKGDAKNGDAIEYLSKLHAEGYTLGLLVNFPDKYTDDYKYPDGQVHPEDPTPIDLDFTTTPDPQSAKAAFIKKLIQRGWNDDRHPMTEESWREFWEMFGDRFLVTPSKTERKDKSPYLFEKALQMARTAGCNVIYQSQLAEELAILQKLARSNRGAIAPFYEGKWDGTNFYLDPAKFGGYAKSSTWKQTIELPAPAETPAAAATPQATSESRVKSRAASVLKRAYRYIRAQFIRRSSVQAPRKSLLTKEALHR